MIWIFFHKTKLMYDLIIVFSDDGSEESYYEISKFRSFMQSIAFRNLNKYFKNLKLKTWDSRNLSQNSF